MRGITYRRVRMRHKADVEMISNHRSLTLLVIIGKVQVVERGAAVVGHNHVKLVKV